MSPQAPSEGSDAHVATSFELRVGERTMQATARLPAGRVRMVELLPVLGKFNDALIGAAVADAQEAGRAVSCRAGCGACCRQVVPISETEALALLEWMDTLPENQQELLRGRFRDAARTLSAAGMLERTREAGALRDGPESLRFALDYFASGVPCPFLVNESCGIYPRRPMKCREYLVTTPAENCAAPSAETVTPVRLPAPFSKVLFHFDHAPRAGAATWLPLVLLLEWGEHHRGDPQRMDDSATLFREFLAWVVEATPEELATTLSTTRTRTGTGMESEG